MGSGSKLPIRFAAVGVILLFAPAIIFASTKMSTVGPSTNEHPSDSSQMVSSLLQQVETRAYQVNHLSDQLLILDRDQTSVGWRGEANTLARMRHQINAMADTLRQLRPLRPEALPWQRKAMDLAALRETELADTTQHVIHFLNHHRTDLFNPRYVADADYMSACSKRLAEKLHSFSEYGQARQE